MSAHVSHLQAVSHTYACWVQCELKRSQETALAELTYAACSGHIEQVEHLLARGLPINAGTAVFLWFGSCSLPLRYGRYPHWKSGCYSCMCDSGDYDGRTALHLAVAEGQTEIVRVLLNKGAKVDVVDRWNSTPLLDALKMSSQAAAELLIARGAKLTRNLFRFVKQASESDSSSLSLACIKGGADPNSCDYDHRSVLHAQCLAGNLKAVESLLAVGADVNSTDRCGTVWILFSYGILPIRLSLHKMRPSCGRRAQEGSEHVFWYSHKDLAHVWPAVADGREPRSRTPSHQGTGSL